MKRLHLTCILALMPFAADAVAWANTIVFSDQDFLDANWTIPDSPVSAYGVRRHAERASIRT